MNEHRPNDAVTEVIRAYSPEDADRYRDTLDYQGDPHAEELHKLADFAAFAGAVGVLMGLIIMIGALLLLFSTF